jgi:peptidoglycan/LPS O-acetylase OafA/YrhL
MKFRQDIEIIRAIAIINVFFFHFGVSFFKYGFLGVDIFFVISGFLMATIYKNTNFKEYFIRRFNRLIPPYYFTIFITLIISLLILEYRELKETIHQTWYALSFISNIGYWLDNTYFNKDNFKPLLHMWSLAIEFQFYFIVPLIAFFIRKNKYFIIIIFFISLIMCFMVTEVSPKTSFFMIFFRIWEFFLGYIIANYALFKKVHLINNLKKDIISVIFLLILIAAPFLLINFSIINILSSSFIEGHPGIFSLFICVITALVITFGIPLVIQNSKIGKVLSYIGSYSYSIYLLHYPIIILYLYKPLSGTIIEFKNNYTMIILMAIVLGSSYFFQKFTNSLFIKKLFTINRYFYFLLFILVFSFSALYIKASLLNTTELNIQNGFFDKSQYRCGKIKRIINPLAKLCSLNNFSEETNIEKIILIGDSHADSIKTSFTEIASKLNKKVYFVIRNDPLMSERKSINAENLYKKMDKYNISHAVIHFSSISNRPEIFNFIKLGNKNNIRISFIMPIPTPGFVVPREMYNEIKFNKKLFPQSIDDYMLEHNNVINIFNNMDIKNLKIFDVHQYFCSDHCKYSLEDGSPLFYDSHHLTLSGSNLLKPLFIKILE